MPFVSGRIPELKEYAQFHSFQGKLLSQTTSDDAIHINAHSELNEYGPCYSYQGKRMS